MNCEELIRVAQRARLKAYAPYSKFRVGAALKALNGNIYTGCNIENISFGATCCAERTAIFKAVSEGEKEFVAIAIVSDSEEIVLPCGICRQVMIEFGIPCILAGTSQGKYQKFEISKLLPCAFNNLDKNR